MLGASTEKMGDADLRRLNELTERIIGCAIAVHRALGPGLLESAYQRCLALELRANGLEASVEVPLSLTFRGHQMDDVYRMDLVVEDSVVVEVKAIDQFAPIHQAQLLTYLRLSGKRVGLMLNFGAAVLKDGIMRRVI